MSNKNLLTASLLASVVVSSACNNAKQEDDSSLKVANGKEVREDEFASVVLLLNRHNNQNAACTGTFLSDSHVITAAHCIPNGENPHRKISYITGDNVRGFEVVAPAIKVTIHPQYGEAKDSSQDPHDIAIVQFPIGSAPDESRLSNITPRPEDEATVVGFGSDKLDGDLAGTLQGEGAGIKRFGTNRNLKIENGLFVAKGLTSSEESIGSGRWVSAGKGDSGGPLFINGHLVGISSSGAVEQNSRGTLVGISRFVDLTRADNSSFIEKHID